MKTTVNESRTEYLTPANIPARLPDSTLPDEIEDEDDLELERLSQNIPFYQSLTKKQIQILMFMIQIAFTEDKYTDTEIAEKFGVNRRTIYLLKLNDKFVTAYNYLIRELAKNLTGEMVNNLKTLAKTQVGAAKLMLEYTGEYVPRSQQSIISHQIRHNVTSDDAKSPQAAIVDFVAFLGGVGYDKDRLIAEVSAAYDALKAENAF